jgi:cation:H+ antiporter
MFDAALLLIGVAFAALGGELFVKGSVGLALWARVPAGVIGATVAAFGTSAPELAVALAAVQEGAPQVAFGNAVGANVANLGLILGLALAISAVEAPRDSVRRDFIAAAVAPLVTMLLVFDGTASRTDGIVMVALFVAWLSAVFAEARRHRRHAVAAPAEIRQWRVVASTALGLALLAAAGELLVAGAQALALRIGVAQFVIGATIVAAGTTLPELAATIAAKLHSRDDIGLGVVLGSTIFNGLFIVGLTAAIHPMAVSVDKAAVGLGLGAALVIVSFPGRDGTIARRRSIFLIGLYLAHLAVLLSGRR